MSNEIQKLPVPASEQRVLDNLVRDLNETYPDKVIKNLARDHNQWDKKVTRLYKNIGYESRNDFLAAYGFTVEQGKGGRPSNDLNAIVEELISRYTGDKCVTSIDQLKEENPDLAPKFKNIQNKAKDLFGMTFAKYLKDQGVLQGGDDAAASKADEYKERLSSVVNELKKRYESKELPEAAERCFGNTDQNEVAKDISMILHEHSGISTDAVAGRAVSFFAAHRNAIDSSSIKDLSATLQANEKKWKKSLKAFENEFGKAADISGDELISDKAKEGAFAGTSEKEKELEKYVKDHYGDMILT